MSVGSDIALDLQKYHDIHGRIKTRNHKERAIDLQQIIMKIAKDMWGVGMHIG